MASFHPHTRRPTVWTSNTPRGQLFSGILKNDNREKMIQWSNLWGRNPDNWFIWKRGLSCHRMTCLENTFREGLKKQFLSSIRRERESPLPLSLPLFIAIVANLDKYISKFTHILTNTLTKLYKCQDQATLEGLPSKLECSCHIQLCW